MEQEAVLPDDATDASDDPRSTRRARTPIDGSPAMRAGVVAAAVALGFAATIGLAWPDVADVLADHGVTRPDRIVHLTGCAVLAVAAALLFVAATRHRGRRRAALACVAAGGATLSVATAAMTTGAGRTVGLIAATGPTTAQIVGMALLLIGVSLVPSAIGSKAIAGIDLGLGTLAVISLTWLAPVRTSSGPGGGLADVVVRQPAAVVLVALMVVGVVLLVRVVQAPQPGDLALVVAALLIPSALYVSLVGQFAGHAAVALRSSTLWWMTGPEMLLVAGLQAVRVGHDGRIRAPRSPDLDVLAPVGTDDVDDTRHGEAVAAAATILSLGAVATHRVFIDRLDPVMLALGLVVVVLSTARLALLQRRQDDLQTRLGVLAATLHERARTDELTGLGNRLALTELLHRVATGGASAIDVFYVDVDEFKEVNDSLGHDVGDQLLVRTAARLRDAFGTNVHRVGGDEFVAVRDDLSETEAEALARRVVAASTAPLDIHGNAVAAPLSLGTARIRPDEVADATTFDDEAVRLADLALNRAKQLGRGRAVVFDEQLRDDAERRVGVQRALRDAIDRDQLEVRYRPMVDIDTGEVLEVEAIVRWRTPDGRLLLPDEYLEVARDTGLAPSLSRAALTLAAAPWTADPSIGATLVLGTTLHELAHIGYVDDLTGATAAIEHDRFRLRISESVLMDTVTAPTVDRLVEHGVRIGVSEFGTSTSSVRRLGELHDPSICVDRSFVTGLAHHGPDQLILEAVTELAGSLGVPLAADGVSRHRHVDRLRDIGITRAQGWLFGPPTDWTSFAARHLDPDRLPTGLEWRASGPSDRPVEVTGGLR